MFNKQITPQTKGEPDSDTTFKSLPVPRIDAALQAAKAEQERERQREQERQRELDRRRSYGGCCGCGC